MSSKFAYGLGERRNEEKNLSTGFYTIFGKYNELKVDNIKNNQYNYQQSGQHPAILFQSPSETSYKYWNLIYMRNHYPMTVNYY